MSGLADDPERRLTLRQAAQARDDFAMIMDELDLVKAQLARLPTRRNQAFIHPPSDSRRHGIQHDCAGHHLVRDFLAVLLLRGRP
jgi:hypothetical protein